MNLEIEIFQYLIKNTEPRIFRKNNHRDSDKNKLRTFEPRGGENFKNIELQRKKSGSYKKKKCIGPGEGREGSMFLKILMAWRSTDSDVLFMSDR